MWNYTSATAIDEELFQWFVFPMLENQNYTTTIVIGSEVSNIVTYFTASDISHNVDKCSLYNDQAQIDACSSVSAIDTQFQVAFPHISLGFSQEFEFNCTSAGTYNNAPMGFPGSAHCSAANCTGLGLATIRADGTRMLKKNLENISGT